MKDVFNHLINLKESVEIDGESYKINTDFRVWAEIERLIFDDGESAEVRLFKILKLAYPHLPHDASSAVREIIEFYCWQEKITKDFEKTETAYPKKSERIYSIHQDFGYIYGAFLSEFGIDLTREKLHWWKFCALLDCLGTSSAFMRILSYRTADLSKIKDKETRRTYERMKKKYKLKSNATDGALATEFAQSICDLF